MRAFTDVYGDTVDVSYDLGEVYLSLTCEEMDFTPDEALKLAAAIRDAAILAKEKA